MLGHAFDGEAEKALELALALDPRAHRSRPLDWSACQPALRGWKPDHRYEKTGTRKERATNRLVTAAQELVDRVAIEMWADGVVSTLEM